MDVEKKPPEVMKHQPINLRKKPRLIIIQPSTKVIKILVTPDRDKTRVWVDIPLDASFENPDLIVDNGS